VTSETDDVLRLERALLDPEVRRDRQRLDALLHDDFLEFGASGRRWDKAAVLETLPRETSAAAPALGDVDATVLAPGVVLVTYTALGALRSSLWLRGSDGAWQMRFHQGTRA
jgi:ribonuclease HI